MSSEVFALNKMIFLLLTLVPLNHTMDSRQLNGWQGRDSCSDDFSRPESNFTCRGGQCQGSRYYNGRRRCKSGKAKPDETLRQKDPVPDRTLESSSSSNRTIPTVKV